MAHSIVGGHPPNTVQQNFVKKFENILSDSGSTQKLANPYFQFTHGFNDPLPTGGHCDSGRALNTIKFPEFPENKTTKRKRKVAGRKKGSKRKVGGKNKKKGGVKKGGGVTKKKGGTKTKKGGRKSTKKGGRKKVKKTKKLTKNQVLTQVKKLISKIK